MRYGESACKIIVGRPGNREITVDAAVAQIKRTSDRDAIYWYTFIADLGYGLPLQRIELLSNDQERVTIKRPLYAARPMPYDVGQPGTQSAQNTAVRMNEHLANPQLAGDGTTMLRRRGTKCNQDIVGWIGPLGDRDKPNRRRHVRIRNPEQPRRQVIERITCSRRTGHFRRSGHFSGQFFQAPFRRRPIQRKRKPIGHNATQVKIQIGDR
jgi:hypothetical protein